MKKAFVYFLCVSFLITMSGFPTAIAETREKGLPFGEMVSKGEVKFEARENVWKKVEPSHFPIFQGTKIKTDKGVAVVTLSNNSQIEVSSDSLCSFDQSDRFILAQGSIEFRIPAASEINVKVRNLSIMKSRSLQAAKDSSVAHPVTGETIGSISIHKNGAVTVKSIQGKLTVTNQDRVVLAAVSSKESITMPSTSVGAKPPVMVAQLREKDIDGGTGGAGFVETVFWVGLGIVGLGGSIWAIHEARDDDHHDRVPVCP